jgi:hypothetical protein
LFRWWDLHRWNNYRCRICHFYDRFSVVLQRAHASTLTRFLFARVDHGCVFSRKKKNVATPSLAGAIKIDGEKY